MSEKVLGFKEKDAKLCQSKERLANKEFFYDVYKKDLVPVVSIEWLEKEIEKLKERIGKRVDSDYGFGWDDGYLSAIRNLLIAIINKKAAEKKAGR